MVEQFRGQQFDAHYLAYFECFNQQLFYEAHEVLEKIWLPDRNGPNGAFYKGLIQLAGAFVHLQKNRPQPAASLLKLAEENLKKYPGEYEGLDIEELLNWIEGWAGQIRVEKNPLAGENLPRLFLRE